MRIIDSIRKEAAKLIVEEIEKKGSSSAYNSEKCIKLVKQELNIDLKENESGNLIKQQ